MQRTKPSSSLQLGIPLIALLLAVPCVAGPRSALGGANQATTSAAMREAEGLSGESLTRLQAYKGELATAVLSAWQAKTGRTYDRRWSQAELSRLVATQSSAELIELAASDQVVPLIGDATNDLLYTPVAPCRMFDTTGNPLVAGTPQALDLAGSPCAVPIGPAKAVMVNFVAKNPAGKGNVQIYPYAGVSVPPGTSIINYNQITTPNGQGMNIANGVIVPICAGCLADIYALASFANTDLIADVLGYFSPFPSSTLGTAVESHDYTTAITLTSACQNILSVSVDAGTSVIGHVLVNSNTLVSLSHTNPVANTVFTYLSRTSASCTAAENVGQVGAGSALPSFFQVVTATGQQVFPVGPGIQTVYLNALVLSGPNQPLTGSNMTVAYYPN